MVVKKRQDKIRLVCIVGYNGTKDSVDILLITHFHEKGGKYYKKIFFFTFRDLALCNSYILYSKSGGTLIPLLLVLPY